ncbi:hypothetical protein KI387_024862, partial [Taxus chinensis]
PRPQRGPGETADNTHSTGTGSQVKGATQKKTPTPQQGAKTTPQPRDPPATGA